MKPRIIAIYLPQYHPIPQNDEFWGKGFTEWVNVAQARPLFKGHYQPQIPADLGFYDLRYPDVREEQARLAKNAGIEGFMYWQYYFGNNRKLLERPFEDVLASGNPDFPFCLGWANHSWQTLTWKRDASRAEGKTMIMEQRYDGPQQFIEHFEYNLPAFKDRRYMTVEGKPIFVIWNPADHSEEIKQMILIWNKLAVENGFPGIHFVAQEVYKKSNKEILNMGFNAIYQNKILEAQEKNTSNFLWHFRHALIKYLGITTLLDKYDYAKIASDLITDEAKEDNVYPTMLAGYDRTPRAAQKAIIFYNFTPEVWRKHVRHVLSFVTRKKGENNIVMLKSWNEWGEGNYMEPDRLYGTQRLDILKEELESLNKKMDKH